MHMIANIKLFLKNTWLLLAAHPLQNVAFSFLCGFFSLLVSEITKHICYRILNETEGIMYIDKSYLLSVWTSIPAVTLTLLFLIVMTLCALFEIGGLLHSFSMAQIGRQTDIWSMMAAGLRTCRKTISPRNWPVMLFVLVLFPMTGALSLSNTAYKVKIPSFIEIGIEARPLFRTLFTIAYVFMIIVEIGIFFSINIYVLQKKNFVHSCKDSFMLGKGHFLNTIVCMALFSLTVNFLISTTVSILFYASGEILGLLPGLNSTLVLSGENGVIEDALKQIIRSVLIPSVNNAALTALFYQYYEENESLAGITPHMFRTREISPRVKAAVIGCAVLMVSCSVIYIVHNYGFLAANVEKPAVCAHRGDNASAPDNSYEAFELAANEGLPWIELDVQITADGVVVAEHDQTLKRRFDISRPVAEMTYEELMRHKVVSGSFGVYEDVRITTLKDVLLLAKEHNISVQIETKPSKKKAGLEKEVLRVVEKTGMRDKVMIISLSSESIAKIKDMDPDIITAHAVFVTWKDYASVKDAENLSAEIGTVTPSLVYDLHRAGKKVFCWTADDPADIQYLVSCGVDVIGTDDPVMVLKELDTADYSGGVRRVFYILMKKIADMER